MFPSENQFGNNAFFCDKIKYKIKNKNVKSRVIILYLILKSPFWQNVECRSEETPQHSMAMTDSQTY